jgi:serine/threonine protein kinase
MDRIGDGLQGETIGPYEVIRSLGSGGMGEGEARLAAAFNHPAIVQIYDLPVEDEMEHIVMEYVAGQSMRALLDERGPLSPSEGLPIVRSLAEGLAFVVSGASVVD